MTCTESAGNFDGRCCMPGGWAFSTRAAALTSLSSRPFLRTFVRLAFHRSCMPEPIDPLDYVYATLATLRENGVNLQAPRASLGRLAIRPKAPVLNSGHRLKGGQRNVPAEEAAAHSI